MARTPQQQKYKTKTHLRPMTISSSHIIISNMRFHAYHGVMEQERIVGNDYLVSIDIEIDISKAAESDDIRDTINYADAYKEVEMIMRERHSLIEHVAYLIGKRIIDKYTQTISINVNVTKKNPPIGAQCDGASVEIRLINNKNNCNI